MLDDSILSNSRKEYNMTDLKGFANVVLPARDLEAGVAAWTAMLGHEPAFVGEDFAAFSGNGVEIGLTALPWVDHPLVFWQVDDIEGAQSALATRGATPLGEIADGSLAEIGTAEISNGDPATGIVDVPGGRLAVLRAPDGNLIGLTQDAVEA
jgi:catechol 2,3-dioxygenase-like lactoylglutathione lyase family enzyme